MTSYRFPARRRAATAAAAVGAALVLAACGGNDDSSAGRSAHGSDPSAPASASATSSSASEKDTSAHNAADVSFAQGMIPHHRQAVEMAGLAATRASSAEVKTLASEIRKAQDPEIRTLSGWLTAWGEDVPAKDAGDDHSAHSMAGMMDDDDMATLGKVSGTAFDSTFLKLMVQHHKGAVAMARTERSQGSHQGARKMAGNIVTTQTAEITRMETLLGQ